MRPRQELAAAREQWRLLTFHQRFEHAIIIVLTLLISPVIILAMWNLVIKVLGSIVSAGAFDPTETKQA